MKLKKEKNAITNNENLAEIIEEKPIEISLYDRLGGAEGISSIVDDIVDTHMENPVIQHVFLPLKDDSAHFELFKNHVKEFLAAGTGGGIEYTGKDVFFVSLSYCISSANVILSQT